MACSVIVVEIEFSVAFRQVFNADLNHATSTRHINRIRWDEHWAADEFKIGYYDRVEDRLIVVSFNEIRYPKDDHFTFEVIDRDGELHSVP